MIMDQIKNDTYDISPKFWVRFESNKLNRIYWTKVIQSFVFKPSIDSKELKKQIDIANMFDILIFLLKEVDEIFINNLNNYLDILNIMCVYSSLIKEVKEVDVNIDINLEEEFINLFNNFENILDKEYLNNIDSDSDIDISLKKEVENSIIKTNELYLRVSQLI